MSMRTCIFTRSPSLFSLTTLKSKFLKSGPTNALRAGNTVAAAVKSAGRLECCQVQVIVGRAGSGARVTDQIRTAKEFAAAVEIIFKQVVHVEGLPGGQGEHSIYAPA